jgi:hypothetical protein
MTWPIWGVVGAGGAFRVRPAMAAAPVSAVAARAAASANNSRRLAVLGPRRLSAIAATAILSVGWCFSTGVRLPDARRIGQDRRGEIVWHP